MTKPTLVWECLENSGEKIYGVDTFARAKISGGWLVTASQTDGVGITFIPDPNHQWQ